VSPPIILADVGFLLIMPDKWNHHLHLTFLFNHSSRIFSKLVKPTPAIEHQFSQDFALLQAGKAST
jgi:hypothetical protein